MSDDLGKRFVRVEPAALDEIWQHVRPHVDDLLLISQGEYGVRDIYDMIQQDRMQLWLCWTKDSIEGVVISYFVVYPRMKKLVITGAAGLGARTWLDDALTTIKEYGLEHGCDFAQIRGRKGWRKLLPDWTLKQEVLEKRL